MTDVKTNAHWEKSSAEKYAEKWFATHGFNCCLVKQYLSKTIYQVSKDGIEDQFELPRAVEKPKEYMQMYEQSFALKKEIIRLKSEAELQST